MSSSSIASARQSVMTKSQPTTTRNRVRRQPGRRRGGRRLGACLGFVTALVPLGAAAQVTEPLSPVPAVPSGPQVPLAPGQQPAYPGVTVTTRTRPDYDPIGLRFGDFFWFPHAKVDEEYNSNIFALPSATSDWITALSPGFDLLSNLPRNSFNLHAGAGTQFYARNPTQNTASGFVSSDGTLQVDNYHGFYGTAGYAHAYIPRTSPNSPGNAAEPVTYNSETASVGFRQSGLRFGYDASLGVSAAQYNPVPLIGGGILPQNSGNTVTPEAALGVNYEIIPDYLGYVRVSGTVLDYTHSPPGSPNFNSTIYRVDAGLQILPRHLIYGQVYAGYLTQVFQQASLGVKSAPDFGGRLIWTPTGLTTLTFNGSRTFYTTNPTISGIGAGYLATAVSATVDHELRYNLLLDAGAGYTNYSYQSISASNNVLSAVAGVRYLLNRNLYLGGTYTYQKQTSSSGSGGAPYSQSIVMLKLSTQF